MKTTRYSLCALTLATLLQLSTIAIAAEAGSSAVPATSGKAVPAMSEEDFIQSMGKEVLGILKNKKKNFAEKKATLRNLFTQVVDTDWIAKFVLGRAWKTATPEQKARYTELYRTYLTETYISKFDEESGNKVQDIQIVDVKDAPAGAFMARTLIIQSGQPNVSVDYLLKGKNGKFKVIDIVIEGISLLTTHRNEFGTLATSEGMEGVIKKLQELTSQEG